MKPILPGFENLPVTKPNKKPIHQQLTDLKHWAQPETDPTAGAYYVPKEQRIYESLKVPGYETPEKSNVSYKKLKEKEKGTYPFDTPQGIDHFTKTVKEESPHKLSPKENKDIDILNKEMKLSVLKKEIDNTPKFEHHNAESYPSDPEQRRRLKNIDKLEKSLGYNVVETNVPYKKNTITDTEIKRRLKNARGPSDWSLITKTATSWQDKQDIREIVNKNYKRDPSSIEPEDRKWLDKDLIEPVKITEYPEIVLGSPPEVPQTTININSKPVEQIVSELAKDRLVREQKDWDQRWGKDGITSLKRPE